MPISRELTCNLVPIGTISKRLLKYGLMVMVLLGSLVSGFSQQLVTSTVTATTASFNVPAGVTKITVQAWGGGGAGGGASADPSGGGGGAGGAFASKTITVAPGNFPVTVGATVTGTTGGPVNGNDSGWDDNSQILAKGGAGGAAENSQDQSASGGLGTITGSFGSTLHKGGNGGTGSIGLSGGGGGESAGALSDGNNGVATTGGSGLADGGDGGAAGITTGNGGPGNAGSIPGGGGGGGHAASGSSRSGGNGARGQVVVSWILPTAAITYDDVDGIIALNQTVRITATFSESIAVAPVMQIALSGANTLPLTNMTRTDATHYFYDHTVTTGNGTVTVSLGTGSSSNGNIVFSTPTSGATFTVDTTAPTFTPVTPNPSTGTAKIGDAIQVNFTAGGAEATLVAGATLTVNGVDVSGSFTNLTGGNYRVTYTVVSGNTDRAAGTMPLSLQIKDVAGNATTISAFTAANTLAIDANRPTVSSISLVQASPTNAASLDFTVVFSEGVTLVDVTDFVLSGTATGTINSVTANSSSNYTVNVNTVSGNGTLRLDAKTSGAGATINDLAGNAFTAGFSGGASYTIDTTPPTVTSISLVQASPTNATTLDFTVVFSESVTLVDVTDFVLSGAATGTINSVVQNTPSNYTVNVNTVAGNGALRLDAKTSGAGATINDLVGNAFTAGFTGGASYTIDNIPPTVSSISLVQPSPTNAASLDFTVVFSESVTLVDISDFVLTATATGTINTVTPITPSSYTVNVNTVGGNGTLRLDVKTSGAGATINDLAGNAFTAGFTGGASYTIDTTVPPLFAVGAVTTNAGGNVVAGYYNSSNVTNTAGITVAVPVPNDVTIPTTGTIQILVDNQANVGFISLGTPVAIPTAGVTQNVTVSHAVLSANTRYGDGKTLSFNAIITDAAGNATTGTASASTLINDFTAPVVNSRSIGTITPTSFVFTINLSEVGTTYYAVTTNPAPPLAPDIRAGTVMGAVVFGSFPVGTASTNINQSISPLSQVTTYYVYSVSEDAATNQSTPVTSNNATTLCTPPTIQATASITPFTLVKSKSMTVNWASGDGTGGVIVIARQGTAVSFAPVSGINYSGQINTDFSLATDQGSGNKIVFRGIGTSVAITNLSPSTTYHFAVYAFNTANDCYLLTTPLTQNQATIPLANETSLSGGTGIATISSLVVTQPAEVAAFSFQAIDAGADGSETQITQMIFKAGPGNNFSDFTQLIAGAELYDNLLNSIVPAGTVTITATTIQIASIPSGSGLLGEILNGATKTYTLKLWLNNPFAAAIRANADGQHLVLSLTNTDVTTSPAGGGTSGSSANSGAVNGTIDVAATKLKFVQQPSNVYVQSIMSPAVTVEATDTYGNRDVNSAAIVGLSSTATLAAAASATLASGFGTYNNIVHSLPASNGNTLSTTNGLLLGNDVSITFNLLPPSLNSDIIANPAFIYPTNIDFANSNNQVANITPLTGTVIGQFTIRDGGGTPDGDQLPTILNSIQFTVGLNPSIIRSVAIYDMANTEIMEVAGGAGTVTFPGLTLSAPDDGSTTFQVKVSFNSVMADNLQFQFTVSNTTYNVTQSGFAAADAGGATTSIVGNDNRINVIATKLLFVQQPSNWFITAAMTPSPTVQSVDLYGNRDLDFTGVVSVTSTGTMTGSPQNATFAAGLGTYSSIVHTVANPSVTLTTGNTNTPVLTNVASNPFSISSPSSTSDIIANAAFTYPVNVAYDTFQENVNIINSATSLEVAQFDIRDGGGAADPDPLPTILTDLSLDLGPNFAFIRRIALYDATGTAEIQELPTAVTNQIVSFSGLSLTAADGGSLSFTVRVSFTTAVTDNLQYSFKVSSASAQPANSTFALPTAGGAVSSTAGDNNRIEVTATKLLFVQQPTTTFLTSTMSPAPTVESVDINNRRDLDFIGVVSVTSTGTMTGSPQNATFAAGLGTYSSIVHTALGTGLTLSTSNVNSLTDITSSTFDIIISLSSDMIATTGFLYLANIPYNNFQEPANIVVSGTSVVVAQFDIRDGGGVPDGDLLPTILTDITFNVTNASLIRRIALYDGVTELGETTPSGSTVTFSGLGASAPDNGSLTLSLRVSFNAPVVDNTQFSFQITSVTASSSGSAFATANGGGAQSSIAVNNNRVAVTATEVRFVQQPTSALIGIAMSPAVSIETTDNLGSRDLDYGGTATITSTGVLSAATTSAVAIGFGTASVIHSDKGTGLTLTAAIGALTNATSTPVFNITASSLADIILDNTFLEPSDILYKNYQATDITGGASDIAVARFIVRDAGGAASDPDNGPTLFNSITFNIANVSALRRVALYDNAGVELAELAAVSPITFSNLNAGLGYGPIDDGTKTFTVRVSFLNSSPSVVDNSQVQFTITNATVTSKSSNFINASAGGAASSIAGTENQIEVVATKFVFTTAPTASIFANIPFSPAPLVLEARDLFDVKDLDYAQSVNITNAGNIPMTDAAGHTSLTTINVPFSAGVLTLDNQLRYDIKGTGNGTLTIADALTPISLTSAPIAINVSAASDIVENTFTYPVNIDYLPYQAADINLASPGDEIEMAQFNIRDGGGSSDADGTSTELTTITFNVTNPAFIKQLALYNGVTELGEVTVSGSTVSFGPFSAIALDNSNLTLSLYATFNTVITDNQQIAFTITGATTNGNTSIFATPNASGATTTLGVSDNKMEVIATQLDFTTPPGPTAVSLNTNFAVVVEGRDINANVDLDFTAGAATITALTNTTNASMSNGPTLNTSQFSAGVYNFPANFQYTSGNNTDIVTLSMTAGGISGTSSPITLNSSSESILTYDPVFTYMKILPYVGMQATNIQNTATSVAMAGFKLTDGNGITNDLDGAPTNISSITLAFTTQISSAGAPIAGAPGIRRIALYDNAGVEIAEQAYANPVTFGGLSIATPGDFTSTTFSVRISFNSSPTTVHDLDQIQLEVTNVQQNSGSKLNPIPGAGSVTGGDLDPLTGAVTGGALSSSTDNIIDVVATKLDFLVQPTVSGLSGFDGINRTIAQIPQVRARDQFSIVDLEHSFGATITTPQAGISSSSLTFSNGILNFPAAFQYTSTGLGTLTVTSNGLSSNNVSPASVTCVRVDVINVTAAVANGGVVSAPNLSGNSQNKVIYGVTFTTPYKVPFNVTIPNTPQPLLKGFTITSVNPINVFTNIRVFESTSTTYSAGSVTDVTAAPINAKITTTSNTIAVDFTQTLTLPNGVPRDLSLAANATLTYFLMVDVISSANSNTLPIQPIVSSSDIVISKGSTDFTPAAAGKSYSFAATFPPVLISSYPASGQLNVATNQPTLSITFGVPVWTLDNKVSLYDQATNVLVQNLVATNGQYSSSSGGMLTNTAVNTLVFNLPSGLVSDHVYYVTIAPGKFDGPNATTNTGIMDKDVNLFPGFSYAGTLYFKTANPNPPKLLSTPIAQSNPNISNISLTGATINGTFDQQSKAFYLVLPTGTTPAPTYGEIKGTSVYTGSNPFTYQGSFNINQTNPISQFGVFSKQLAASQGYDVWIAAESYSELNGVQTPIPNSSYFGSSARLVKTGTITATATSAVVTGSGTFFTTELSVGRTIFNAGGTIPIGNIKSITSNTSLTLTTNASAITGQGYSASGFGVGDPGPTLQFVTPATAPAGLTINKPSVIVCKNSYQVLNAPIVIIEGFGMNEFACATCLIPTDDQTFNLVLPAGFQFDISLDGAGLPVYGSITLSGADFVGGSGQLGFLGNNILTVKFKNSGAGLSLDNITISGLRVLTTTTVAGKSIVRLGGNAFTAEVPDNAPVALLSSFDAAGINFTNSYFTKIFPTRVLNGNPVVTVIPDNYDDPALPIQNAVELIPLPPAGDYGLNSFSGSGVNVNFLNLGAVTLGIPFNIAVTHTDNNGCISENEEQYTVYNHATAIKGLSTNYCAVNTNFPAAATTNTVAGTKLIKYDNLSGYLMIDLAADIPPYAAATQIINGTAWKNLLANLTVKGSTVAFNFSGTNYYNYTFDNATILNAKSVSGGAITIDPYDNFKSSATAQNNFYWKGGSLGIVEFTANYQSIANSLLQIPLKQPVEFFVPAIPLVEVGQSNESSLDISDPLNPVGSGGASNKGTPIFCKAGGKIDINGYPAASAGSSVGTFMLLDANTSTILPSTGFTDNLNGTALLDPTLLNNNYRDIKIVYTYQDNNSPCQSSSYQIIRISPNPVAGFTWNTFPLTNNAPTGSAQCARQDIQFNSTTTVGDPTASVTSWSWNFGDVSSSNNIVTGTLNNPSHKFDTPSNPGTPYVVSLSSTSNWKCASVSPLTPTVVGALSKNVDIGGTPVVKFKLDGISTADTFNFNSNSTNVPFPLVGTLPASDPNNTTVSANDKIVKYDWDFGDLSPHTIVTGLVSGTDNIAAFNSNVVTHTYATPGPRQIDLTVTSNLGCVSSLSLSVPSTYRSIVVLPRVTLAVNGVYVEDFEASNGNWQVWGTGKNATEISINRLTASWAYGAPPANIATPAAPLITKTKIWKTNLSGNYNAFEKSALYSPSFNLTNLTRPMISFNSVVQMEKSDGVVLEYATDNLNIADPNKVWKALGAIGDGEDWFTDQGIAGRPGTQLANDYGWSGSDNLKWQTPKHILDTLGKPYPAKAVFRLALGSAAANVGKQGFAVDNVRIGDRTRTILLESFANTSNTNSAEKTQNTKVAGFVSGSIGTEVVKINYHVNFPGKDPFNEDNPADPSSRALYYNIVTTPRSRLDGEADPNDRLFSAWVPSAYALRSLQLAQADITITPVTNPNGSISISVNVISTVLNGIPSKTIVHVAILEQTIALSALSATKQAMVKSGETTFDYTLKKMLPSAAGSPFGAILANGASRSFGPFVWTPDPTRLYQAPGDLAVAVFLQQENAPYEVYQVELVKSLAEPSVVTGLEPIPAEQIVVYPSPANHEMNIMLPGVLAQPAALQMIDQVGRVTMDAVIPQGANSKTINTRDLSAGIYILQIDIGNGNFTRKKVMVIHE